MEVRDTMRLRRGYVPCPDAQGRKGRCGYKQRLPRSVSACVYCNQGAGGASRAGLPEGDAVALDSAEDPQATYHEDGRVDFSELKGRDRVKAMQDELAEGMLALVVDKKALDDYLDFVRSGYKYSARNLMLIKLQNPNAYNCKTYKQWQALGYQVNKGAKSLQVLRPYIKQVQLEDKNGNPILDDNGEPKKAEKLVGYGSYGVFPANALDPSVKEPPMDPLTKRMMHQENRSDVEVDPNMHKELAAVAEDLGVRIRYSTPAEDPGLGSGSMAYITSNRDGSGPVITLNRDGAPHGVAQSLAHELGHYLCGHMDKKTRPEDKAQIEVEAESVSYALCRNYGLDVGDSAFAYLKGWAGNDPKKVQRAVGSVTKGLSAYYTSLEKILGGGGQAEEMAKAREAGAAKAAEKSKAKKDGKKKRGR